MRFPANFVPAIAASTIFALFSFSPAYAQDQEQVEAEAEEILDVENLPELVATHFADLARATYEDAVYSANTLREDLLIFLGEPNEDTFEEVRDSWQTARVVYKQAELVKYVSPITASLSQHVDVWPIDEGFIDQVDDSYAGADGNPLSTQNIIASSEIALGDDLIALEAFTPDVLSDQLHGAAGFAQNAAAGFQVIEFMLWGQDTDLAEAGEGSRSFTDFDIEQCPDDFCQRRGEFTTAAVDLLVADLTALSNVWSPTGAARVEFLSDPDQAIWSILSAMGAVSTTELLTNNLDKGLQSRSAEMESDAFSDYSHASYLLTARGIMNSYLGDYFSIQGETYEGPSIATMMAEIDTELDREFRITLSITSVRMRTLLRYVRDEEPLDSIFVNRTKEGVQLIEDLREALNSQADALQNFAKELGLEPLDFSTPAIEMASIGGADALAG